MSETRVSVGSDWDDQLTINLRSPIINNGLRYHRFDCRHDLLSRTARTTRDTWVQTYGCGLWAALLVHDAVKKALTDLQENQAPLYFELENTEAERLLWETLCDRPGHFIALDADSPICRVVHQVYARPDRAFTPPLRMLAILSAHNVPAEEEWRGLLKAFTDHADRGLPLRLHVMVSEQELFNQIQRLAGVDMQGRPLGNGGAVWLSAGMLPRPVSELLQLITDYSPHILHLFCHGRADVGQPRIEIASPLDWGEPEPREPLILEVAKLRYYTGYFRDLWFATLNFCGSAAIGEVHSLTTQLVTLGLPAAVGMREPIGQQAANDFSRALYAALIPQLIGLLRRGNTQGEPVEINWPRLLDAPRGVLSDKNRYGDPSGHREWTVPVLYVGNRGLRIDCRRDEPTPTAGRGVDTIREAIDNLPREATPPEVLVKLRAAYGGAT